MRIFKRLQGGARKRKTEGLAVPLCGKNFTVDIKFIVFLRKVYGGAGDNGRLVLFRRLGKQFFKVLELMGKPWAKDLVHVAYGMVGRPSACRRR